jgi:hypothetical protein
VKANAGLIAPPGAERGVTLDGFPGVDGERSLRSSRKSDSGFRKPDASEIRAFSRQPSAKTKSRLLNADR